MNASRSQRWRAAEPISLRPHGPSSRTSAAHRYSCWRATRNWRTTMIQSTHEDASFKLLDRATAGHRLSAGEIRRLYDLPIDDLAAAANELRLRHNNPELSTYSIGGNIDYNKVCVVACRFCAFYRAKHQEGAFTLTR